MSSSSPMPSASGREQASRAHLVEELERRIDEIEALDDSAVGHFTPWDWLCCVVGGVVIPSLAMWWFAP